MAVIEFELFLGAFSFLDIGFGDSGFKVYIFLFRLYPILSMIKLVGRVLNIFESSF